MAREVFVAKAAEIQEGQPVIVAHGEYGIGVYRRNGAYYAYQNLCAHQGGPACEGLLMAKVEEVLGADRTFKGLTFNHDEMHVVCPWHGWEYRLADGVCVANPRYKLRRFEVTERDGDVYVVV